MVSVDFFESVERHIRLDYHDGSGCGREKLARCEEDHYPQVRAGYGEFGLLWLMTQNEHYQGFSAQYDVAVGVLARLPAEEISLWRRGWRWIRCWMQPLSWLPVRGFRDRVGKPELPAR